MDIKKFKDELLKADVIDVASAAAFWLFLALMPLLAVAGLVAAKLAVSDRSLVGPALASMPAGSRDLLEGELGKVAGMSGAIGPVSIAIFFWLASSGIHALLDAFDKTTECERAWWKKRLIAIGICVILSIGVAVVGVVLGLVQRGPFVSGVVSLPVSNVLRYVVAFVVEVLLICGIYALGVTPEARRAHRIWPGAILAALTHTLLGFGYVEYVRHLGNGSAYQAGLATIGVTMIAVFVFTLSLLVGLTLNKLLPRKSSPEKEGVHHAARHSHVHGRGAHRKADRVAGSRRRRRLHGQGALRRVRRPHGRRVSTGSAAARLKLQ